MNDYSIADRFYRELQKQAQSIPATIPAPTPAADPKMLLSVANTLIRSLEDTLDARRLDPAGGRGPAELFLDDLKDLPSLLRFLGDKYVQFGGKYIVQAKSPATPEDPFEQGDIVEYAFPPGFTDTSSLPNKVYVDKKALIGYLQSLQQQASIDLNNPQSKMLSLHLAQLIEEANQQLKLGMSYKLPVSPADQGAEKPEGIGDTPQSGEAGRDAGSVQPAGFPSKPTTIQQTQVIQAMGLKWPLQQGRIDFQLIKEWLQLYQQLVSLSASDQNLSALVSESLSSVNSILALGVPVIDLTTEPQNEMRGIYRRLMAHPGLTSAQSATLPQTFLVETSNLLRDLDYLFSSFDRIYGSAIPADRREDFQRQIGDVSSLLPTQRQQVESMLQYNLPQAQRDIGRRMM
jgi:hypothetical protein